MMQRLIPLVPLVLLAACGDDSPTESADASTNFDSGVSDVDLDSGADAEPDASLPDAADTAADLLTDAESDGRPYFSGGGYILENSHVNVVRQIIFTSVLGGVIPGFDLDGHTTTPGNDEGCGKPDLTAPDGTPGVDNQLGNLWPALAPLIGTQLEGLLQGAVNEGRVLIMVEIAELDDLQNDDSVTVNIYRGLADPEIGTLGFISPNQTYQLDYGSAISTVENVEIVDGRLFAGPLVVSIPIDILDVQAVLVVEDAYFDIVLDETGAMSGVLGGAFSVDSLLNALFDSGARAEAQLIEPLLRNNVDMSIGSDCGHLSLAIELDATKAYVVRDAAQ